MRKYKISAPDKSMEIAIRNRIDNLNKPKGSLGRLEDIALQVCLVQQTLRPSLSVPCHLLFGGDHGIEREGVSVSPREVTWQQMVNFSHGGGGVNMFCRQHGFKLRIVDVGVDHDLSTVPGIIDRKIAPGTGDFLHAPAMSSEEMDRALAVGEEQVEECKALGCNIICIGEMGIGNTSPSSVWMNVLGDVPLDKCIGAGSGLNSTGMSHKADVLRQAVERFNATECPLGESEVEFAIRYFGGFEMVAAIGAMLRAAELHLIILIDGFIMTACALAATRLYPESMSYMIFGHQGDESGHKLLLDTMGAKPLLNLGLRLGEGTGALCAYPLVDSAVRMMNEMNDFENAHITKYF